LPDGQEWNTQSQIVWNRVRFAGMERDTETGSGDTWLPLDYSGARYFQSQIVAFTSPDIPGIDQDPLNPQSWNLYGYARNNPLRFVDPTGRKCENGYDAEKEVFCSETVAEDPSRRANDAWLVAQQFFLDSMFNHLLTPRVVDFSAGLGDALLLGTGPYFRRRLDIDVVDRCSNAYSAGAWSSFAFGASRVGYAGLAKGASMFASSGARASAFRQGLKTAARLGMAKSWRQPNLAKYSTDEALRAAVGRTNPLANAWGAGTAVAGATGALGCGR
jgi:RHS repeat-associated protein